MSFTLDALQSRSRQEASNSNKKPQCNHQERQAKRSNSESRIIATMGEVAKGLADSVSNVINKIWPNVNDQQTTLPKPNPLLHDVTIDVDAMIVYDQPIEGDFVEVAFASQVQTPRKRQPSIAEDIAAKHMKQASLPITIPDRSRQQRTSQRYERHYI